MSCWRRRPGRGREAGMTILELIVVLAIIALIAAVVAPQYLGYLSRAKSQTTQMQIQSLKSAVRLYFVDVGAYPSETEGLAALVAAPPGVSGWSGPYIDSRDLLQDAWGRDYLYRSPGRDGAFEILSLGRDGAEGGSGEDADVVMR